MTIPGVLDTQMWLPYAILRVVCLPPELLPLHP